jgi:alkane 1-monooxygenase
MSIYHFAPADFLQGLRNAWTVERARIRRCRLPWWHNRMLQDYALALGLAVVFFASCGSAGLILFVGQAVFAVFCFEVITYVHHYGLVLGEGEEAGPQHAWAHYCWITNCLTFNNTFQGDHHLRPSTPTTNCTRCTEPAAAGKLLHNVLRGAHAADLAFSDGPSAGRVG